MTTETKPVEYEQVTVKVPKLIMDFLRKTEGDPVESIEFTIVDGVRADIEGMTSEAWAEVFSLNKVFYEVLGDQNYKPKS